MARKWEKGRCEKERERKRRGRKTEEAMRKRENGINDEQRKRKKVVRKMWEGNNGFIERKEVTRKKKRGDIKDSIYEKGNDETNEKGNN